MSSILIKFGFSVEQFKLHCFVRIYVHYGIYNYDNYVILLSNYRSQVDVIFNLGFILIGNIS